MSHSHPYQQASVSWIAPDLADPAGQSLVAALLDRAAGIEPAGRDLTRAQCQALAAHRLLSLVPRAWNAPSDFDLRASQRTLTAQQLVLVSEAQEVFTTCAEAGIDNRVLKGAASCFLDFPEPGQRTFGDIDLLVQPGDFDRTRMLLQAEFGATTIDPGRYGYRFEIEATMTLPSGTEIDVHHRLSPFSSHVPALFGHPVPVPDLQATALPAEARLCHAALHVFSTPPGTRRLSGLADIAAMRSRQDIDLATVRALAAELGTEALVGTALAIERNARNLPVDTDHWAALTRLERLSFARPDRHMLFEQLHRVRQITGATDRARFVASRLMPNRSQLDKRGGIAGYFGRLLPNRQAN